MNVVITGANRGLGLALCQVFLEEGSQVFALYRSKGEALEPLSEVHPDDTSGRLIPIQCDVSDEFQLRSAYEQVRSISPSLDVLINNAAIHLEQSKPDVDDLDFSVFLPTFKVNSVAPLMVSKNFLPLLRNGSGKCIISISSEAGSIGNCWRDREYAYCMSKTALNMAMRILQNRLKDEQFRVRLIHPGWVRTDMGGTQAQLSPEASARAVFKLVMETMQTPFNPNQALYIDWEGTPLAW